MSKKLCIPVFSTVKGKLLFIWQNFLYNLSEKAKPIGGTGDNRFDISLDVLIKEDAILICSVMKFLKGSRTRSGLWGKPW